MGSMRVSWGLQHSRGQADVPVIWLRRLWLSLDSKRTASQHTPSPLTPETSGRTRSRQRHGQWNPQSVVPVESPSAGVAICRSRPMMLGAGGLGGWLRYGTFPRSGHCTAAHVTPNLLSECAPGQSRAPRAGPGHPRQARVGSEDSLGPLCWPLAHPPLQGTQTDAHPWPSKPAPPAPLHLAIPPKPQNCPLLPSSKCSSTPATLPGPH